MTERIMTERICQNCRYYYDTSYGKQECRRNPPLPGPENNFRMWPSVSPRDWCGEWDGPLYDSRPIPVRD